MPGNNLFIYENRRPTCGCIVVVQDLTGGKGPFPDDKFIKGPGNIMTIILIIASPNDEVRIGVSIIFWYSANRVISSEGPINIDF